MQEEIEQLIAGLAAEKKENMEKSHEFSESGDNMRFGAHLGVAHGLSIAISRLETILAGGISGK